MKLSVFTVATPDLTSEQLLSTAKAAGFEGVEWRYKSVSEELKSAPLSFWGNHLCSIPEYGSEADWNFYKDASEAQGLQILSVTPYITAGDLEETERVLKVAKYLGARFIRLGVPRYDRTKHFNELFELERTYIREAEALCKQYGVKGLVETHHVTIAASASATYRIIEGRDPNAIGVLFDPCNMVYEGFENYRMGLELLGPYVAHVHMKNASWAQTGTNDDGSAVWSAGWASLKQGIVPWKQVIDDLKATGYDGWIGFEDFSKEEPTEQKLHQFVQYVRSLL
ncbi:sugar phosphate isomerase/epimerase [Paenibacillus sp. WQ 127069]|uniref:Sugar phosphate isomerase/epimerase n=1 Tax=Paenibacillus baimaensis TaxID=2982185 RepID=A0ABT2UDJ0_9BACL|nr:sugar phosphate isomerase/epimerase [Paenibacillus sp. WQ 127069]MCU6792695.1 sugar phosphate isomerase/epimerase [Paenibacillus sp. WQ 127069]